MFRFFRERRRKKTRKIPFPTQWLDHLNENVPYFKQLTPEEREELCSHVLVFLDEKQFEGCGGLVMTDEIRVTIAGQACILLLHRKTDYYPALQSIVVYPDAYQATSLEAGPGGMVIESTQTRLGESWSLGTVVLSWNDVQHGAADVNDGRNVVFHEFAHQLDSLTGDTDGAPILDRRSMYVAWARVLGGEYEKLLSHLEKHRKTIIDAYGGTNPAEFFAVVTESFFEQPRQLKSKHPELYEQFELFYKQDPLSRLNTFDE